MDKLFPRLRALTAKRKKLGGAESEYAAALELLAGLLGEEADWTNCERDEGDGTRCGECWTCRARAALDSLGWTPREDSHEG